MSMLFVKDLGMQENSSGNRFRVGLYTCTGCDTKVERYTHNVKAQELRAEKVGKVLMCRSCMLTERNTKKKKVTSTKISKTVKKVFKPVKVRTKYRNMTFNTNTFMWEVEVPIPRGKGKKKYLGEFKDEELAQDAIVEFLSHYNDGLG